MRVYLDILAQIQKKSLFPVTYNSLSKTFICFYKQNFTLSGSDLLYHFVSFPPHSTSPIPQGTFSTFGLTLSHGQNSLKPQLLQVVIRTQHVLFSLFVHFFSSSVTALKHNLSLSILAFFLLDL